MQGYRGKSVKIVYHFADMHQHLSTRIPDLDVMKFFILIILPWSLETQLHVSFCLNTEAAKIVSGATNLAYSERPVREVGCILLSSSVKSNYLFSEGGTWSYSWEFQLSSSTKTQRNSQISYLSWWMLYIMTVNKLTITHTVQQKSSLSNLKRAAAVTQWVRAFAPQAEGRVFESQSRHT